MRVLELSLSLFIGVHIVLIKGSFPATAEYSFDDPMIENSTETFTDSVSALHDAQIYGQKSWITGVVHYGMFISSWNIDSISFLF